MLNKLSVVYDNNSISLENITTVGIVGDNGVGKTTFLERIALANENNLHKILNYKGFVQYGKFKVNIDDQEVECNQVKAGREYLTDKGSIMYYPYMIVPTYYRYDCVGSIKYNIMIVYPDTLTVRIHYPNFGVYVRPNDDDMKFNEFIKPFISNGIVLPTQVVNDFIYENNDTVTYLDNLGKGISNLVKLLYMIYLNKPDILLIDDIETLGLHPERLKLFFQWISQRIQEGYLKAMLFTTNSDAYFYLAEVDKTSKFLLLSQGGYEIMDSDEVLDRIEYEDLRYTALKLTDKQS